MKSSQAKQPERCVDRTMDRTYVAVREIEECRISQKETGP